MNDLQHTWVSLLPFIIVIVISMWSKEILPGLILGLLVGSFLLKPHVMEGLNQAIIYIIEILTNKTNIEIILFLYLFGGLVGMMQVAGGIKGFAEFVRPYVDNEKKALLLTWISIPFTIITPMFRIMIMAPILRAIKEKIQLSKKRIGYILDISTEPIIVLIPVGTAFVGYMVSVVKKSLGENKVEINGLEIFLKSIPLNFFAIIMIIIGLLTSFALIPQDNGNKKENQEKEKSNVHRESIRKELSKVDAKPFNFFLPLLFLIILSVSFLWVDGTNKGAKSFLEAFTLADTTMDMLLSIFVTLFVSGIYYMVRKENLNEILFHFFDGGNQMMTAIVLLILVWSVAMSAEKLGFSSFISSTFGNIIPNWLIPTVIFLVGSTIGYFIGTSWGTWGLIMPLGVSLAVATNANIPLSVGAVFASGTFGAFASPLGDTTITTSTILDMSPVDYSKYKLKISLIGALLSCIFYLGMAFLLN